MYHIHLDKNMAAMKANCELCSSYFDQYWYDEAEVCSQKLKITFLFSKEEAFP